jgi:hypothetical protein
MAQMVCSGTCTDLMTDRLNCGACGKACAVGQGCQMGMCVAQPCTCISLGGNGEIKATPAPDNHYWPGGAITIEAWVRPAGMSVGNGALISSGPYTFKIPALTPRFDFSTVRGMPGVGGGALTVGRWSHLAVVWDGTAAVTFFQDGKRHSSNMVPKDELTPVSGKIPMVIGSLNSAAFNGWVSEVRLSKVARYTMDFQPTARFTADADTLALFHLAEVGASNAQDSSSLMSHGTIDSAVWAQGCPP